MPDKNTSTQVISNYFRYHKRSCLELILSDKNDNSENIEELVRILHDLGLSSTKAFKNYVEGKGEQEKALVIDINSKSLERIAGIQLEKQKRIDEREERNRQFKLQVRREGQDYKIRKFQAETERIKVLNDIIINLKEIGCSITIEEFKRMLGISESKITDDVKSQGRQKRKIQAIEYKSKKSILILKPDNLLE